jgi:hypothetical protein
MNVLMALLFMLNLTYAAIQLQDVVLAIELDAESDESSFQFPCMQMSGVVFCDNRLLIEDQTCAKSLKIDSEKGKIICNLQNESNVQLATYNTRDELHIDDTAPYGFRFLHFSERVRLNQRQVVPGGLTQYSLQID